jgi:hypothetical protein
MKLSRAMRNDCARTSLGQVVLMIFFNFSVNNSADIAQIVQYFSPMLSTG